MIVSDHDEVVTPPQADSFLPAGPNVTNQTLQDTCPGDPVGHLGEMYDPDVVQLVLNALDPAQALARHLHPYREPQRDDRH